MTYTTIRNLITIGQKWTRNRDKTSMTVRQVHRKDKTAEMIADDGTRMSVSFSDLRRLWSLDSDATVQ